MMKLSQSKASIKPEEVHEAEDAKKEETTSDHIESKPTVDDDNGDLNEEIESRYSDDQQSPE